MKPEHYVTIRVATNATSKGPSGEAIDVMARILRVVHGQSAAGDFRFASAFPMARTGERAYPGTALRVFTQEREQADLICDAVEGNTFLAGYVHVGRVRRTPMDCPDSVRHDLFRTWSRKDLYGQQRIDMLQQSMELPYLKIRSTTNGHSYSLRFGVQKFKGTKASETVEPNSYGLSVASRAFTLPDFELEAAPWSR